VRAQIKRALVAGYCWQLIPGWFVDLAFRLLRLRSL